MNRFEISGIKDFNLDHIFDCGQCFRWEKQPDGSYTGIAFKKIVNMQFDEEKGKLVIDNCTDEDFETIWRPYLDLDRDYGEIKEKLAKNDPVMQKAIEYGYGIRILKQDLWETIISFIISQNNNIPRIKGCIENLAMNFGAKAGEYNGKEYYGLPGANYLGGQSLEKLGSIKVGYRARYLRGTGRAVTSDGLPKTKDDLMMLCGIGPKVANCIALFGLGDYKSFPIDVWMSRVMSQLYGLDEKDKKGMQAFAEERFGDLGGFAQQYLFYYMRETNK